MSAFDEPLASLGRWLDEAFAGFALRGSPIAPSDRARVRERFIEAADFYDNVDVRTHLFARPPAIDPTATEAERFSGGTAVDLRWPSTFAPLHRDFAEALGRFPENRTCYARWLRHGTPRPAVILLHGWSMGFFTLDAAVLRAGWLYARGLDVVHFVIPFHGYRAPVERLMPPVFPSYLQPARTTEAFAQTVTDLRALAGYLREQGAPEVGVFGMSLGGFTAALTATAAPEFAFMVAGIPFASLAELAWPAGTVAPPMLADLDLSHAQFAAAFSAACPLDRPPVNPDLRAAIVFGEHDRMTPPDHAERLHAHFPGSRLIGFPGAHLLQRGRQAMFDAVVELARG